MVLTSFAPRLFIGDIDSATDLNQLNGCDIKAVVTCGPMTLPWCHHHQCSDDGKKSKSSPTSADPMVISHVDLHHHPHASSSSSSLHHLTFDILDTVDTNLLCYLDQVMEFIDGFFSKQRGNVLIHCWAGQSRSASICAAYLMRRSKKSFPFCLDVIRKEYSQASPNNGFIKQLLTYERMGYKVEGGKTQEHLRYRMTLLAKAKHGGKSLKSDHSDYDASNDVSIINGDSNDIQQNDDIPESTPLSISTNGMNDTDTTQQPQTPNKVEEKGESSSPSQMMSDAAKGSTDDDVDGQSPEDARNDDTEENVQTENNQQQAAPTPLTTYSCRICRTQLFDQSNVLQCQETDKVSSRRIFAKNRKEIGRGVPQSQCSSVFVESMEWMGSLGEQSGKLVCSNPRCLAKLGGYSWHGHRCSCGTWQTPAFQVHLSKVDKLQHRQPIQSLNHNLGVPTVVTSSNQ